MSMEWYSTRMKYSHSLNKASWSTNIIHRACTSACRHVSAISLLPKCTQKVSSCIVCDMQITYPRADYSSIETWMKCPAPPNASFPPDRLFTRFSSISTVSKGDWPKRPRWSWRFLLRSSFFDRCCLSAYHLSAEHKPAYQSTHAIDSLPPSISLDGRTVITYPGNQ